MIDKLRSNALNSPLSAGNFVCDVLRVAWHLVEFFCTGKSDMKKFELWRSVHCRSNGLTTDILNTIIEMFSRKVKFDTVEGIAGQLSRSHRQEILQALRKDGLYMFPDLVSAEVVEKLRAYAFSHESEAYPALEGMPGARIFNADAPISPTCWHPQAALFADPTVQDLVTDKSLLAIAGEYLQVVPRITTLALWHSSHKFAESNGTSAQLYHFDLSQPKWLKFFIYITDVTPESGPHAFVRGSHHRDKEGSALRARGIQRISDADIERAYGKDRIAEISAPKGTMFAADTRAWHKGVKPLTEDRLVFQIEYSNCAYSYAVEDIVAPVKSAAVSQVVKSYPEVFARFKPVVGQSARGERTAELV
jgi:hypothetical protein